MRITSGTRSRTSKIFGNDDVFCILSVTFNSPSSNMRALESLRMETTLPRAAPSSPDHSSARRPLDATSAWFPMSAAHVRNTKITTAIVTSWVFRSVKPSRYMATARLPSMADLRLHMFDSPQCVCVSASNRWHGDFAEDGLNDLSCFESLDLVLWLPDDTVSDGEF